MPELIDIQCVCGRIDGPCPPWQLDPRTVPLDFPEARDPVSVSYSTLVDQRQDEFPFDLTRSDATIIPSGGRKK
jgi:hypothetical protein